MCVFAIVMLVCSLDLAGKRPFKDQTLEWVQACKQLCTLYSIALSVAIVLFLNTSPINYKLPACPTQGNKINQSQHRNHGAGALLLVVGRNSASILEPIEIDQSNYLKHTKQSIHHQSIQAVGYELDPLEFDEHQQRHP
jgi:hypothetical protein